MPHPHDTRFKSKQGENKDKGTESDMEEKEEQPTPEVEVTAGDTVENQPEKPVQRENETFLDMMMRVMMERFDRLERDNKEMMEELCQKMDNNTKKIQL